MAAISIFIFRKRMKDAERSYKVHLYPIVPLIFILISTVFILNTLVGAPLQAGAGIALMVLGLPVYFWFKRKQ
jgi:APA family basic amino acid/polyamine antiporter